MMLSKFKLAGFAAVLLALPGVAGAADYKIDPSHSFVQFRIKHLGFSWLMGRFNKIEGSFVYDPAQGPGAQKITVVVDTSSVDTNFARRDKHLRSADFLDVNKFPRASFRSTGFAGDAKGGAMTGDLVLHGVTKKVEIAVKALGEGKDPWGGYRAGFEGSLVITRKDFGMGFDLGPASETMELELFVEGIKK